MSNEIVVTANKTFSVDDDGKRSFKQREEELAKLNKQDKEINKKKKNSPYTNFLQVNKDTYKKEDALMKENPLAYRVWRFLAQNMDNYNALMVSYTVLTGMFEVSRTTMYRAIKILEEGEYVKITKSGTSNIYSLNDEMVWSSWGTNLKYSKFRANVIIAESEQTEEKQKQIKLKSEKHTQVNIDSEDKE